MLCTWLSLMMALMSYVVKATDSCGDVLLSVIVLVSLSEAGGDAGGGNSVVTDELMKF